MFYKTVIQHIRTRPNTFENIRIVLQICLRVCEDKHGSSWSDLLQSDVAEESEVGEGSALGPGGCSRCSRSSTAARGGPEICGSQNEEIKMMLLSV